MDTTVTSRQNSRKTVGLTKPILALGIYSSTRTNAQKTARPVKASNLSIGMNAWIHIDTAGKVNISCYGPTPR